MIFLFCFPFSNFTCDIRLLKKEMNQPRPPNDFDHIARRGLLLSNTLNVYYFYSEPQIDHLRQVEKIKRKKK